MAEAKRSKKRKPARTRKELRFVAERNEAPKSLILLGMLGALLLGAGVYGQWVQAPPWEYSPYLIAAGAVALGAALWFSESRATPIRVGDAGIAEERGQELQRILWCDIERIKVENDKLRVTSSDASLALSIEANKTAIAWILKEATRRVPDVVDVKRSIVEQLPKPKENDGERVAITAFQITGRDCKASGKTLAFEQDARLCPNCAQVYHKEHVPKKCLTCNSELAERAYRAAS